jgi:acid phosphatase type 7
MNRQSDLTRGTSNRPFTSAWAWTVAALLAVISTIATAAPGVTVAVTGDIDVSGAKVVSEAILDHPAVSAVLLAGDTCNAVTTPAEKYQKLYQGTFDRFLPKIYPCPGNHDQRSKPAFSGYVRFWGPAAHAPEMYYSFDLGGWHIISLDSVTLAKGGAQAAGQLQWLKTDLALNPGAPVLVFWHFPLFSNAKHRGAPKMKPLWDVIYAHGPAIVINGHNHVYERFAPMDPDGQTVSGTQGIREFVISPGGAKPVVKASRKPKGPRAETFHGGTHHVGFFTLHADGGFSYTIQSIAQSGAKEVVDQGSGNLLGPKTAGD